MKRLFLLLAFALCLCGCIRDVPIREELISYEDGSTIYMPVLHTGNVAVDKTVNDEIRNRLKTVYLDIKKDREGLSTEGFTAYTTGDMISIFHEGVFEDKSGSCESYLTTLHINFRNGRFYSLDDLFKSGYKEKLTEIVTDLLEVQLGEYFLAYNVDLDRASFDIFDGEIIFIFNPQTIAPDHIGFVEVAVSFSAVDELLNKEGEMYKVIEAGQK